MTSRPAALCALTVLIGGLVAACGSGSTTAAGPTATSAVVPTTPAASSSAQAASSTSSAPASSAPAPAAGGDFCGTVRKNLAYVSGSGMTTLLTGGTPAAWKAYLDATRRSNQQLVDAAPAAVRPAVQTLQKDSDALAAVFAAAGYDSTKVRSSELLKSVTTPQHRAASTAFTSYVKTSCGIDLTKAPI